MRVFNYSFEVRSPKTQLRNIWRSYRDLLFISGSRFEQTNVGFVHSVCYYTGLFGFWYCVAHCLASCVYSAVVFFLQAVAIASPRRSRPIKEDYDSEDESFEDTEDDDAPSISATGDSPYQIAVKRAKMDAVTKNLGQLDHVVQDLSCTFFCFYLLLFTCRYPVYGKYYGHRGIW